MKKFALFLLLSLSISVLEDCKDDSGGDASTLLALLSNRKCKSLPKTIVTVDGMSGMPEGTNNCSASGLVYTCIDNGILNIRTYSSVDGARLGTVESPDGMIFFLTGQRGLTSLKIIDESDTSNVFRHFTFVYDSAHRLVSLTNLLTANTDIFSNYDGQGFPVNSDAPAGYSYNYAFDTGMPSGIFSDGLEIDYDSKGWAKSWNDGSNSGFFESSGAVEICE